MKAVKTQLMVLKDPRRNDKRGKQFGRDTEVN